MTRHASRRGFLKQSTAWTATAAVYGLPTARAAAPSERVNLAAVGVGGKGWSDIVNCSEGQNVVAFCDVETGEGRRRDRGYSAAVERWPHARRYTDWRQMLDKEHGKLDGITVSTPDHMHAPVTMTALQMGLATYTQKPLTRTLLEARRLRDAARKAKVATQMGNQGHNRSEYRTLVQLIQDGAVGKIREAHAWSNRPIWPQGIQRPGGNDPIPKTIAWDLWLGVAQQRPYKKEVYHPFNWRGWFDFGAGALGDMGCHILDPVVWGLDLGPASTVRYEGPAAQKETFPAWEIIHYEFPGTRYTSGRTVQVKWYDGDKLPSPERAGLPADYRLPKNGTLFVGDEGAIVTNHVGPPQLLPEKKFQDFDVPKLETRDHYQQWTQAIRGQGKTTSDFDYAGPLTETVLLGTVAARVPEETLRWNAKELKFDGNAQANNYIHQEYRKGWEVEGLG